MTSFSAADTQPPNDEFPYEQLLAYHRGELSPDETAAVEELLRTDPRWQKHYQSIEFLDLERAAAVQDTEDLKVFRVSPVPAERRFCFAAARSRGQVFQPLGKGEDTAGGFSRREWTAHCQRCVYCRRLRRQVHARDIQAELPGQELLLRDWLLEPYYATALEAATASIAALAEQQASVPATPSTLAGLSGSLEQHGVLSVVLGFVDGLFQSIQATGWDYRTFPPGSAALRTFSGASVLSDRDTEKLRTSVDLNRQLSGGRGQLSVRFRVMEDDSVACDVELKRSPTEPTPLAELTLRLEIQGESVLEETISARQFRQTVDLPPADAVRGISVRLLLNRGTEVWEDCQFRFQV